MNLSFNIKKNNIVTGSTGQRKMQMLKRASAILCSSDIHEINHTGDDRGFISMSFLHDRRGIDSEKNYNRKVNLCSTLFALQFFHTAIFHQFTVQ